MMSVIRKRDKETLRELGKRYAELAALPVQAEKRSLWRKLNALQPERPMVMVDQVCWHEMDTGNLLCWGETTSDGAVAVESGDSFLGSLETYLRRKLYQWEHFPVDLVIDPWIPIYRAVKNSGFGIEVQEDTVVFEPDNSVISHHYKNLLEDESDIEKIKMPEISHDVLETERRLSIAHDIFDGIIDLRLDSHTPYLSIWDQLTMWMNVEAALYSMMDRPEFIHRILARMTDGYMLMLDQLEEQGLLCQPQSLIHCTGGYSDELPKPGYDPDKPRCHDIWMFGLAQMLGTVSPEMFDEFEVQYTSRICERFGLVYYGCCDPLDKKMAQVRKLPNVRKVSMSPWADQENGASEIGSDFVFSSKPNPANVAMSSFDSQLIRRELSAIKDACQRNSCPLEFILKDISTVCHDPERLDKWAKIAMEVAEE